MGARKPILTLPVKASAIVVVMLLAVIAVAAVVAIASMREQSLIEYQRSASSMSSSLGLASQLATFSGDRDEIQRLADGFLKESGVAFVAVFREDGSLLGRAVSDATAWDAFLRDLGSDASGGMLGGVLVRGVYCSAGTGINSLVELGERPLDGAPGAHPHAVVGHAVVGLSTAPLTEAIRERQWMLLSRSLVVALASILPVWLIVGKWTRRLSSLAAASERIAAGDLDTVLVDDHADEIGQLASSFEQMRLSIGLRNQQMRNLTSTLHQQVRERTKELEARSNDLQIALEAAESASRAKSAFLANMSHEIRTPMTAILGYTDLLDDAALPPSEHSAAVAIIRRSGDHLLSVLNDILDISKIEAGKFSVERAPCDPCRVVADVASLMRARAAAKSLQLVVRYDGPVPATITTDVTRLRQILMNLLGNSIKFTEEGVVVLSVRLRDEGPRPVMEFAVADTGMGISRDKLDVLFKPFSQSDESMSRRFGGTGLGLAISRRLAEMLGGTITVRSTAGRGSTFTVSIDPGSLEGVAMRDTPGESIIEIAPASGAGGGTIPPGSRVLLVEDGVDNQRLIALHLRKAGASVDIAENGRIGLDRLLESAEAGTPFRLVLMDMQMPVMDGYTAARAMRCAGYRGPIIALTAHAMNGDRERCIEAGCDEYLTKPIDREVLVRTCARWVLGSPHRNAA